MRQQDNIVRFANEYDGGGDKNKATSTLIARMEHYTKHYMSEKMGINISYDTKCDLEEKGRQVNEIFLSEINRRTNVSLDMFDGNKTAYGNSQAVVEMAAYLQTILVDTALPIFMSASNMSRIAEFQYAGYGDRFKFTLEDVRPYQASKMGRRQKHIKTQERKRTEKTIGTEMYGIGTRTDVPKVLLGESMVAKDAVLSALGISIKVYELTVNKFKEAFAGITNPDYIVTNFAEKTVIKKLADMSAKNGDKMIMVGDAVALKDILPDNADIRIMLQDEYNTTLGFMSTFNTYQAYAFDAVANDNEPDGILRLDMNTIYGISPNGKPIKVALGYATTVTDEMRENQNLSINTTIAQEIGVELVTNKHPLRIDLA